MAKRVSLSGNEAVAIAMRQINPDVVAAFPITPSTEVPQYFSNFVANGLVDTEFVPVESEHSAMSACIGASAAGGRVMTATSSCGLAYMYEMLYIAASSRLPLTLAVASRALSGPINIHNDHGDVMGARDSGFVIMFAENCQEAYDNFIQAVKIGEHADVQLPVMAAYDGFITSHAVENMELLEDAEVNNFVGKDRVAPYPMLGENPVSYGPLDMHTHYFEHKAQQVKAMANVKKVALEVAEDFAKLSGRNYGLFEEYKMEDAEYAMVAMGSSAGTAKAAVDELREQGKKVGLLKVRFFRPFPGEEMAKALANVKAVAVMDKFEGFSSEGSPIYHELVSAMYGNNDGKVAMSFIYGLGGRDVRTSTMVEAFEKLMAAEQTGKFEKYNYIGVRE